MKIKLDDVSINNRLLSIDQHKLWTTVLLILWFVKNFIDYPFGADRKYDGNAKHINPIRCRQPRLPPSRSNMCIHLAVSLYLVWDMDRLNGQKAMCFAYVPSVHSHRDIERYFNVYFQFVVLFVPCRGNLRIANGRWPSSEQQVRIYYYTKLKFFGKIFRVCSKASNIEFCYWNLFC